MLIIIVPVMSLIAIFAWRYRQTNTEAPYNPEWHHSTALELVIWAVPLLIIICLGAVTWTSTHLLDPYRPIGRIDATRQLALNAKPLRVQVVALDWKWLFIYPDARIATVNELDIPVGRPIHITLTSGTVMQSLMVPQLAGQIYAMAGMTTQLNFAANRPGIFRGENTQFNGDGFQNQKFAVIARPTADYRQWMDRVRADGQSLDAARYARLAKRSVIA
eukprot:gene41254-50902_t